MDIGPLSTPAPETSRWSHYSDACHALIQDLDHLFFMGRLFGHCRVKWCSYAELAAAIGKRLTSSCFGVSMLRGSGHVDIRLNAKMLAFYAQNPKLRMFQILLHECWW